MVFIRRFEVQRYNFFPTKLKKKNSSFDKFSSVPITELFSNTFLEDLEKIWALRFYIPDPTKPILPPNMKKKDGGDK